MTVSAQFLDVPTASSLHFNQRPLIRALAAALLAAPLMASAATIQVTSNGNGIGAAGVCTLRSAGYALDSGAVNAACTTATGVFGTNDTITFAPAVTLINFDSYGGGIYVGNKARTIQGTGFGGVTLQRTAAAATNFSVIQFTSQGSGSLLTLDGLTIEGGNSTGDGGGVKALNYGGNITINNSIIRNNVSAGLGGGVYANYGGSITISNSSVTGNSATGGGGGVFAQGSFNISGSTFSANSTANGGGGAYLSAWYGDGLISNTTVSGNTSTTAGPNGAPGLLVFATSNGGARTVQIRNSTIVSNTGGAYGGAILRCTGGSIILNSTIAFGNGAAIDVQPWACTATTMTGSNNLVGAFGSFGTQGLTGTLSSNPLLGSLANNGGNTLTHALLVGSPAINAGSNPGALATDQRGGGFPRVSGAAADIGAFEVAAAPVVVIPPATPVPVGGLGALLGSMLGLLATGFASIRRRRL